jgi:flagellar protein FlaG
MKSTRPGNRPGLLLERRIIMMISQVNASGSNPSAVAQSAAGNRPVATDAAQAQSAPVEMPGNTAQAATPDAEQVKQAVQHINNVVKSMNSGLKFSVDDATGIRVVQVVDTQTKDVIRQIPTQEVLDIAKALDKLQGLIINQKA